MAPGGKRARRGGGAAAAGGGEGGEGAPAPAPGPGPPARAPRGDRADLPPELLEASRPALRAMPAGDPFWEELKRDTQEAMARRVPAPPAPWADLPPELFEKVARAVPAGDRLWFRLVCRSWAAAGAGAAPAGREEPLPPGKVTRTRGADAAASVTRAVMVLGALEGPPAGVKYGGKVSYSPQCFKNDLCLVAAFNGHLAVLQWARAHGCTWDGRACMLQRGGTSGSCSGRGSTGAPGTNRRAHGLPRTGTSRSSNGRGPRGAAGTERRARTLP